MVGQSGKYHCRFGGASCKPDFCVRFCSYHDLHVGAVYANLWEAYALHKQIMERTKDIAKSPSHEPLPEQKFREYYGIFRLGQYFTETWTPLKIALINMLSRATG